MRDIKISKKEKQVIYRCVGETCREPRSRALRLLSDLADHLYAEYRSLHGWRRSPHEIVQIVRKMRHKDEYQKELRALRELKRQGLVKIDQDGERLMIAITRRGQSKISLHRLKSETRLLPEGTCCYVAFDIPESVRQVRWRLRKHLKNADFVQVQKSIWRTNRDVADDVLAIVKDARAERWITVIIGTEKKQP